MKTVSVGQAYQTRATPYLRRLRRRLLRHHLPLAGCVAATLWFGALLPTAPALLVRLTIASAYLALALLAAALLVSPIAALRGRPAPPSSDLRRDLGIWMGASSLIHAGLGLWARFGAQAYPIDGWLALLLLVGAAFAGVAALEITILLLAISNDAALRRLGLPRWKRMQRLAIWLPALVTIHGVLWAVLAGRGALAAGALAVVALVLAAARARAP